MHSPLSELVAGDVHPPLKFLTIDESPDDVDLVAHLKELFNPDLYITRTHPRLVEGTAPGLDKGQGLLRLCSILGVDPARVLAVGDSDNDIPVLEVAGYAVAMGGFHPRRRGGGRLASPAHRGRRRRRGHAQIRTESDGAGVRGYLDRTRQTSTRPCVIPGLTRNPSPRRPKALSRRGRDRGEAPTPPRHSGLDPESISTPAHVSTCQRALSQRARQFQIQFPGKRATATRSPTGTRPESHGSPSADAAAYWRSWRWPWDTRTPCA